MQRIFRLAAARQLPSRRLGCLVECLVRAAGAPHDIRLKGNSAIRAASAARTLQITGK